MSLSSTNYVLTTGIWRKITEANESAKVWIHEFGERGLFIHRSDNPQGDTIAVGSQAELDAGLSADTSLYLQGSERVELRPDVLDCVYYALYSDPRESTGETSTITVQVPLANIDVVLQDQITPFNDFFFLQSIGQTTLTAPTVVEDPPTTPGTTLSVASVAQISIGDILVLVSGVSGEERFYQGEVLSINVLDVECDNPMDFAFDIADVVVVATKDMNVDGSTTPQVFEIRAGGVGSTLELDVTRLIMKNLSATAVDLSKFGDIIGGLTYGMFLRENNGVILNKWNTKTNGDLALLAYDWTPLSAANPAQGQDGFLWRYTLSGQDKHGVAFRIGPERTLQMIIQDDLTTLTELTCVGANHEVVP